MEIHNHKHDTNGNWLWGLRDGTQVVGNSTFDIESGADVVWGSATCSVCGQIYMSSDALGEWINSDKQ